MKTKERYLPDKFIKNTSGALAPCKHILLRSIFLRVVQPTLLLIVVLSSPASSQPTDGSVESLQTNSSPLRDNSEYQSPELEWHGVERVNITHSYLSTALETFSRNIDTFFGKERVYEESSGTYVQARGGLLFDNEGHVDYDIRFRTKFDFPQLESRVNLLIESIEDESFETVQHSENSDSFSKELESSDLSASLQYIFSRKNGWNISLRPGANFSSDIEAFLRLRVAKEGHVHGRWLARGTMQLGYYSIEGLQNLWKLELERKFGKKKLFRSSSSLEWQEEFPGNQSLEQSFLLTQLIDRKTSLVYEIGMHAETRPKIHASSYYSHVRYRRNIHRNWLFWDVMPRIRLLTDSEDKVDFTLWLGLEVLFGSRYVQ